MDTLETPNNVSPKKLNFEHVFRPVYYFSRFAGLWPFSIIRSSNGSIQKARCGPCDILWLVLVVCFNLTLALDAYEQLKAEREEHEVRIRFVVDSIFEISSFLFITIGIVLDAINRNTLVLILKKFNTFDLMVSHFSKDGIWKIASHFKLKSTIGFSLFNKTDIQIWRLLQLQV